MEGQRKELDSEGRAEQQAEGHWQSHPPAPSTDSGQRRKRTCPGSLASTAGARPPMLPLVHCPSTRPSALAGGPHSSRLRWAGAASCLSPTEETRGLPRASIPRSEPSRELNQLLLAIVVNPPLCGVGQETGLQAVRTPRPLRGWRLSQGFSRPHSLASSGQQ